METDMEPSPVVVASPAEFAPVGTGQRFATLDVLRGVAILGILLVNILYFSRPLMDVAGWRWDESCMADSLARAGVSFFAVMKFMTIFSLLFGMGLALQSERAEARGRPFAGMYARRLTLLFGFGLLHGTLLWYGDILLLYAVLGFIALLCRKVRPRRLLIVACILFVVPMVGMSGCMVAAPGLLEDQGDWSTAAADLRESLAESGAPSSDDTGREDPHSADRVLLRFMEFMEDETRIYQSGTYGEIVAHRSVTFAVVSCVANFPLFGWRCLAMFLLGMSLIKWGLFRDNERSRIVYARLMVVGLCVGIPLSFLAVRMEADGMVSAFDIAMNFLSLYMGSMGMSLAYASGIAFLCTHKKWVTRLAPLAATGRMALSNYLGQSIICCVIFTSQGFGLFGRVSFASVLLIALGIFVFQLVLSSIWLRHFRFGPFEWLWRSMTYWKRQPMRLPSSPSCATQSEGI